MKKAPNHPHARVPAELLPHRHSFKEEAWKEFTLEELGHAVAFFVKRSMHRAQPVQQAKDLYHANNYVLMMLAHIDAHVADMGMLGPDVPVQPERSFKSFVERFL